MTKQPEDKVNLVRSFYENVSRGNIDGLLATMSQDVDWELLGPNSIPYFGKYKGHDGVKEFFQRLVEAEDLKIFEPKEYLAGEGSVTVLGHEEAVARQTGKAFTTKWAQVFYLKGGKITKFVEYIDTAPMVAAYSID